MRWNVLFYVRHDWEEYMKRIFGILALSVLLLVGCSQQQQTPGSITVSVLPGALTLSPGGSSIATVQIGRSGYDGNVQLYVSGVPAGVNVGVNSNNANTSGLVSMSIAAATNAVPGDYMILLNAMGTGVSASTIIPLTITQPAAPPPPPPPPPPPANLAINLSASSLNMGKGESGNLNVALVRTNLTNPVSLAVKGAPVGVLATFSPSTTTGNSTTLALSVGNNAIAGKYNLTVEATSGDLTKQATLELVIATTPDYNVSAGAANATVGSTGTSVISVTPTNGFTGTVALGCAGLPSGITCTFANTSVTVNGGPGTTNLNIGVASSVAPGIYSFTVKGTSGSNERNAIVTLNVVANGVLAGFEIAADSISMGQGANGSSKVSITPTNGFSGLVTLSCINVPNGLGCSLDPSQIFLGSGYPDISSLRVTTAPNVAPGVYNITIKASTENIPNGLTKTVNVPVIVGGNTSGFNIAAENLSVPQGQGGYSTVTITPLGGFTGEITFGCSGVPAGVTCEFVTNPVVIGAAISASGKPTTELGFNVAQSALPGTYPITVQAVAGTITRTTTLNLVITPSDLFILNANPREQSRLQGQRSELGNPYLGADIGVPIARINVSRGLGFGNLITFSVQSVIDPSGATRPISDLFTLITFDDEDIVPVAPFENSTTGNSIRLYANINPTADIGRWQVRVLGEDAALGTSEAVVFGLRIDPAIRIATNTNLIQMRQGQQRGDTGDQSLRVSMITDPRVVAPTTLNLGISAVRRNGLLLQRDLDLGASTYFDFVGGGLGLPIDDANAIDCSTDPAETFHSCWAGDDILGDFETLTSITIRDNTAPVPLVENTISNGPLPVDNSRFLRVRFSPQAPTGTYTYDIVARNPALLLVEPQPVPGAPPFPDVDGPGGGVVDFGVTPVVASTTLTVNLFDNYYTLAGAPTSLVFEDPGVGGTNSQFIVLTPALVGDTPGGGDVLNPALFTEACTVLGLAEYDPLITYTTVGSGGIGAYLNPLLNVTATITKLGATVTPTQTYACRILSTIGVPTGFSWWEPRFDEYSRIVRFTVIDR